MPVEFSCLAIKTKLDVLIKFLRGKIALSKLSTSNYIQNNNLFIPESSGVDDENVPDTCFTF